MFLQQQSLYHPSLLAALQVQFLVPVLFSRPLCEFIMPQFRLCFHNFKIWFICAIRVSLCDFDILVCFGFEFLSFFRIRFWWFLFCKNCSNFLVFVIYAPLSIFINQDYVLIFLFINWTKKWKMFELLMVDYSPLCCKFFSYFFY